MENTNNEWRDVIQKTVEDAVNKLRATVKTPSEPTSNPMSAGAVGYACSYYNPHNFRVYFDFSRKIFHQAHRGIEPSLGRFEVKNSTELSLDNFHDCRLTIKKNQIEVVNKIEHKRFYVISIDGTEWEQVTNIVARKIGECLHVLKLFLKEFDLPKSITHLKYLSHHCENKAQGDELIDRLPLKMKFETDVVKKVYNERNVEYKEPVLAANYFSNLGIYKVAPEIASRLDAMEKKMDVFNVVIDKATAVIEDNTTANKWMTANIQSHEGVLKGIGVAVEKNTVVSESQLNVNQANLAVAGNINESINKLSETTSKNTSMILEGMHNVESVVLNDSANVSSQVTDLKVDVNAGNGVIMSRLNDNRNIAKQCDNRVVMDDNSLNPQTIKEASIDYPKKNIGGGIMGLWQKIKDWFNSDDESEEDVQEEQAEFVEELEKAGDVIEAISREKPAEEKSTEEKIE